MDIQALRNEVLKVLNSDLTNYYIESKTGLTRGNISKIRNGYRKVGNLSLDTCEKLASLGKEVSSK
ncbi:hypothetical protein [Staphylococcus massiliensis]|uniref:HTH cro/C1-type domain-containing protein n=1 Tax=Staphylococcus massiliensis S46 TaxID=1229783 RepID=K9AW55_9STAP|nr:hypothetical protein [Staphylococcus massiliensis]EKU50306.1 hypothetical protein C273_01650 [Staphylococcus massiliensis S46]